MNWRARGSSVRLADNGGETGKAFAFVVKNKSVTPA